MIFQQFNLLQNETVPRTSLAARTAAATANRSPRGCASVWRSWAGGQVRQPSGAAVRRPEAAAIARALASEPAVLLCDEPTSALDPETTRSVLACCATSTGGWA